HVSGNGLAVMDSVLTVAIAPGTQFSRCISVRLVSRSQRNATRVEEAAGSMVMLSELCHFHLVDGQQRCARLLDMAVALLDVDYPPITQVLFQQDAEPRSLPWETIQALDWQARHMRVTDLAAGQALASTSPQEAILLQRDILDALILDLQHRRVTRANDLWLEEHDKRWRLAAADTSARALVRRLSRGRYGRVQHGQLDDWKYVEFLRGDPQAARSGAGYHRRITRLPP